MAKRTISNIHPLGISLVALAILIGFFVASALYQWEARSRSVAFVAASTLAPSAAAKANASIEKPVSMPVAPQVVEAPKVLPMQGEQSQTKVVETKPATSEIAPTVKENPPAPQTEEKMAVPLPSAEKVSFQRDVMPILQKSCIVCHGALGGLNLKDYGSLMATGNNKPQVIPGKPTESLLVKRLEEPPYMPTSGPLPASDILKIKQWIMEGAGEN